MPLCAPMPRAGCAIDWRSSAPASANGGKRSRCWRRCGPPATKGRARLSGDPALEVLVLGEDAASAATAGLVASADLGEALERNGNGAAAQKAFRDVLKSGRSPDAALGLLRTASVAGDFSAVGDA